MKVFSTTQTNRGFTLLFSIIVSSLVLAVGIAIINITLKQFILSGISEASEKAFYAANAGSECLRYWDRIQNQFDVPGDGGTRASISLSCMGQTVNEVSPGQRGSGDEQHFQITWGNDNICTDISIWKFYSEAPNGDIDPILVNGVDQGTCPEGSECTFAKARGYNRPCDQLGVARTVERELTIRY